MSEEFPTTFKNKLEFEIYKWKDVPEDVYKIIDKTEIESNYGKSFVLELKNQENNVNKFR